MRRLVSIMLLLLIAGNDAGAQIASRLDPAPWASRDLATRLRTRLGTDVAPDTGRETTIEPVPEPHDSEARRGTNDPRESPASWFAMVVMVAAVAVLVTAVALHLSRRGARAGDEGTPPRARDEDLRALGERQLAQGDLAGAVSAFHRHAIASLRRAGLVPAAHHYCDGLVANLLTEEDLRRPFVTLVELFQPIRYGRRPAAADAGTRARDAADALASGIDRITERSG